MRNLIRRPEIGAVAAFVITYLFFAVMTSGTGFVSADGTAGWLNLAAELGIIAIPVGLLMISGEFDLSIGSTVGMASMILALGTRYFGLPDWSMILLALAAGGLVGLINGYAVVRTGLPSFIVTLAANFIVIGGTMGVSRLIANVTSSSASVSAPVKWLFAAHHRMAIFA